MLNNSILKAQIMRIAIWVLLLTSFSIRAVKAQTTWGTTGNSGTNSKVNFLGNTDNHPLVLKINGLPSGYIDSLNGLKKTAFGYSALSANTTGLYNTAFGFQSLTTNTIGGYNTAIGVSTLMPNTSGNYNTAIGYNALSANTTGGSNTALGYLSLSTNTTGSNLIGIGNSISTGTAATNTTIIGNGVTYTGSNAAILSISTQHTIIGSALTGQTDNGSLMQVYGSTYLGGVITAPSSALATGASSDSIITAVSSGGILTFRRVAPSSIGSSYSWGLTGASGTNSSTNFLGNTDNHPLILKVNGVKSGYIDSLSGNMNASFGYSALSANTTGIFNSAFGALSLSTNTAGSYNTALGSQSLQTNTTGNNNVAVGYFALQANTSGGGNTALGYDALPVNSTASLNTAVGAIALQHTTTGGLNSGLGYNALGANTTGAGNTGLGTYSLSLNTIGSYNTAVGNYSLSASTNSNNNTAIGASSLQNLTTGGGNTGLGALSLQTLSTGSNNIGIGYNIITGAATTNTTIIGNGITYTGNNAAILSSSSQHAIIGSAVTGQIDNGSLMQVYGSIYLGGTITAPSSALATGASTDSILTEVTSGGVMTLRKVAQSSIGSFSGWGTTGNNSTNSAVNFLGSTDNHPLVFKVNGIKAGYIDSVGGAGNTGFGIYSLLGRPTGSGNTGIGVYALSSNSSGQNNTALGISALNNNTSANWNTAVGAYSLYANTTGINNTGLGAFTLQPNTTGNSNTGIGTYSLQVNTTGSNNTGVGTSSLVGNTTGTNNTALGGNSLSSVTTGSNNIGIGYGANVGATSTNTTIIGNGITYTGSNAAILSRNDQHAIIGSALTGQTDNGNNFQVYGSSYFNGPMNINATNLTGMGTAANVLTSDATGNMGFTSMASLGIGASALWAPITTGSTSIHNTNAGNVLLGSTIDNGNMLQVTGSSSFMYPNPTYSPGGVSIRQFSANLGTYAAMEIAGTSSVWTAGQGLIFHNNQSAIEVGANFYGNGNLGGHTGWFGTSGIGAVSNTLELTADATNTYITSLKYSAPAPYPDLYISAPDIYFNTKSGAAWPDGVGGSKFGNTGMMINQLGNMLVGSTTDNGQKFQVTGSSYFNGPMNISTTGLTGMGTATNVLSSDANGNIGFTPISNLGSGSSSIWAPISAGSSSFYNTNAGNVIIGANTDNGYKFQVNGSTFLGTLALNGSGGNPIISGYTPAGTIMTIASIPNYGTLRLGGGNQNAVEIYGHTSFVATFTNSGGGMVGIGTNNPTAQLHTTGAVRFAGLSNNTGTATNVLTSDANGNVGYTPISNLGSASSSIWAPITTGSATEYNTNTGNILIGSTTDNGSKLQVTGTGYFSGNVGIGTTAPGPYQLAVEGIIGARKVKVTQANPWADYVFDSTYQLSPLPELEKFIQTNKHLPGVPSTKEVAKDGLDLGDNQALLLKKIEELTLYVIDLNKKVETLNKENEELKKKMDAHH